MIETGSMAPEATFLVGDGQRRSLSSYRGRPLVLYFYPKDDTSGCTSEARAFTALLPEFEGLGVEVLGASKDSPASHARFATKHGIAVPLASDTDGSLCEAFGVWVEKSMYGKKYMGIERATFLLDAEGRIAEQWRKVRVPGHAEDVLAVAQRIASAS